MDESGGARPVSPWTASPARRALREDREKGGDHFSAPLGSSRSGRLRLTGGAHGVAIRADPSLRGLCRARLGNRAPTIWVQGGAITIRQSRAPAYGWLDRRPEQHAEVALNGRIPWEIEVRGGASRLTADLRGLRLASFALSGGVNRLEVALPTASGAVAVLILGGASNVAIGRPEGASARLRVEGGVTNLEFDGRHTGAAGGELDLRDGGYDAATDRYDIAIAGGANNVVVGRCGGTTPRFALTPRGAGIGWSPTL